MLNRLYVIIGLLAIIALGAAFIVPRFVPWDDYRDRMEAIASEALGAKVEIVGDISFSLLPQPELHFSNVVVGPSEEPLLMVDEVVADFSLLDFLRDRYVVTKLLLTKPVFDLKVDENGLFDTRLKLAEKVSNSNISVANASITNGTVRITDARSGQSHLAGNVEGELSMAALKGPFVFQGSGLYDQARYVVRISTGKMDEVGAAQLSLSVRPEDQAFLLSAEGFLTTGPSPRYLGQVTYRQAAPKLEDAKSVQGDLVFASKLDAGTDRVILSNFTLQPDENRAGARLTGAVAIRLGDAVSFDAAVSGGVVALPPRDATEEIAAKPYEIFQLLADLPPPPMPPIAGSVAIDITEFDLGTISLRNFDLEASVDAGNWQIDSLAAILPGNTAVTSQGTLSAVEGRPEFYGTINLVSKRLDGLASIWRKPVEGNPLFNMPGSLQGGLTLVNDVLSLEGGTLVLDEGSHALDVKAYFGTEKRLSVDAHFSALDQFTSPALLALLPEPDARFNQSFPQGNLQFSADSAVIGGFPGKNLTLNGAWTEAGLQVDRFIVDDLGGISLDGGGQIGGTLAKPSFSGDAGVIVSAADAPALSWFYDRIGAPAPLRQYLAASAPAELTLTLGPPGDGGAQSLAAIGTAGAAQLTFDATMGQGIAEVFVGPISASLNLSSEDPTALTAQLGLGGLSLVPAGGSMSVAVTIDGTAGGSFETSVSIGGGTDTIDFEGTVMPGDLSAPSGGGTLKFALSDVETLALTLGLDGVFVPALDGTARISFVGGKSLGLAEVKGTSSGAPFAGDLQIGFDGQKSVVSGILNLEQVDVENLTAFLAGPAALLRDGMDVWPQGPFAIGDTPRRSAGRVSVQVPEIVADDRVLMTGAAFDLDWDATAIRLRAMQGAVGDGKATLDVGLCCAGPLADKQMTGRLTLVGVDIDALLPAKPAGMLGGRIDAGIRFDGTGDNLASLAGVMTGEGSFVVNGLEIESFAPGVFTDVAGLQNIVDLQPADFAKVVEAGLDKGAFKTGNLEGTLTIAGGVVRIPNLAAEAENAKIFGSLSTKLRDLNLAGDFKLSPSGAVDENGLINETTAGVTAVLSGTLNDPTRSLGIDTMVDAIKVRALELELDRLEQLQAEDEARRKATLEAEAQRIAAEDAARKAEEQRKAEEAARLAAEQEAARLALEAEANRIAAEQQQVPPPVVPPFNMQPPQ